jgi:methionyl-tRNA formyltransferase
LTKENLNIIFLGTPDFAVASLNALVQNEYNIVAVITAPDKPAGRGMQLQQSAVKKYALEKNIPVLQPEKLKSEAFLDELKSYKADVQVVVAFRMLPEVVWNMPPLGTINVHASLLPNYRGAAPINWAIINGEKETGVTTFKLKHEIDTGDILLQQKVAISETENVSSLYNTLMHEGGKLIVKTLDNLLENKLIETPQEIPNPKSQIPNFEILNSTFNIQHSTLLKHAPKIFTETCKIDFTKTVHEVYNHIRGLSEYPCAFTTIDGKKMKLYKVEKTIEYHTYNSGKIDTDNKKYTHIYCSNGFITLIDIQLEGKKRMLVEDFLRGYKIENLQ